VWPQLPAQGEGLLAVVGFGDDFDTIFSGEHGSETFSDQSVIVCYQKACRRRLLSLSQSSYFSRTHHAPAGPAKTTRRPESNRLKA
jgi:hypothetical protein